MCPQAPHLTFSGKGGGLDVKQQTAHSCLNLLNGIDQCPRVAVSPGVLRQKSTGLIDRSSMLLERPATENQVS